MHWILDGFGGYLYGKKRKRKTFDPDYGILQ
jgi:hypothetical protein